MNLIEFKSDEAVNLYLALRPYFGYGFAPGSTVSSLGVLNPPLINFLIYPLTLISTDPKTVSFIIGILNSLMIAAFFILFQRYYGFLITLISSLFLALSPWQIIYSRKIWAQDFVFLFLVPLLFSVQKITVDKDSRYWLLFAVSSLFLIQVYVATVFFVLLLSVFLMKNLSKRALLPLGIGTFIGLLPLLPYVFYQFQFGCPDCSAILNAQDKVTDASFFEYGKLVLQSLGTGGFYTLFGSDYAIFLSGNSLLTPIRYVNLLYFLIIPFGALLFFRKHPKARMYVYITLILPLLYFLLKMDDKMHYFIVTMPFVGLFVSHAVLSLKNFYRPLGKIISVLLLGCLFLSSIGYMYFFSSFLMKYGGTSGEYGAVYAVREIDKIEPLDSQNSLLSEEEYLLKFIPSEYALSTYPFSKMVYSSELQTWSRESLERKYESNPTNTKARNLLIAFYTYPRVSRSTVKYLFDKSFHNPDYTDIYQVVKHSYASQHYRAFYEGISPILLDYPSHWKITSNDKQVSLKNNNYILTISDPPPTYNPPLLSNYEYENNKDDLSAVFPQPTCLKIPCPILSEVFIVGEIPINISVVKVEENNDYQDSPYLMLKEILDSLWDEEGF